MSSSSSDLRSGYLFAAGAFGWWAFIVPSYFRLMSQGGAPPLEVLAQRVLFGLPILIVLLSNRGKLMEYSRTLLCVKSAKVLVPSTVLIAINWFFFIYAVDTNRLNHASLGYYINPLFSILLGYLFLGEKLSKGQRVAILIACCAVGMMTVAELQEGGGWPWISVLLPASFGLYGLLRKKVQTGPMVGIAYEMTVLMPVCLFLLFWLEGQQRGAFLAPETTGWISALMLLGGVVTIVPLLCFTSAVRLLPLSTVGLLQFTAPTGQLALSVLAFGESFSLLKFGSFVLIWIAIGVFVRDLLRSRRAQQAAMDTEMLE